MSAGVNQLVRQSKITTLVNMQDNISNAIWCLSEFSLGCVSLHDFSTVLSKPKYTSLCCQGQLGGYCQSFLLCIETFQVSFFPVMFFSFLASSPYVHTPFWFFLFFYLSFISYNYLSNRSSLAFTKSNTDKLIPVTPKRTMTKQTYQHNVKGNEISTTATTKERMITFTK